MLEEEKKTHRSWLNMKSKCTNKNHPQYATHGALGIEVCSKWAESFEEFIRDMGVKPEGKLLGRKDKDKGFNRQNCVWMSKSELSPSKWRVTKLEYKNVKKSVTEWAKEFGLARDTIWKRVFDEGWTVEKALEYGNKRGKRKRGSLKFS